MNEPPAPLVTIIIPAHNCVDMTCTCLDSIRAHTEGSYEIILIDDASDPSASAAFKAKEATDLRVLRNETRCTFSANNNQAARLSQARYLCLLNNDTRVSPGWLSSMVAVSEREPDLAVLGNRHLFPQNDMLHHCGIGFDEKGFPVHLHPNTPPLTYAANVQRDLQCVTFACVLIPREAYEKLGGLDEAYRNGFEDCDFCLKARAAGYRIVYTPASTIYHHGQATPGRTDFDNENWKLFDSRWHGKLEHDLKPLLQSDRRVTRRELRARRRPRHGGDGFHFSVNVGEGSAFAWASAELIRELDAMGQTVSLDPRFGIHSSITGETRRVLRRAMRCRPCRTFHLKWSHYWEAYKRQPLAGEVNAEFFCTNYLYPPDSKQLDLWSRHVQVSSHRWLPISGFNKEVLTNLGVPDHRMRLAPLGYAPEIDRLFPEGAPDRERDVVHLLVVTNSHDLPRYGTDVLIKALSDAFSSDDPVIVHIKDYGAGVDTSVLRGMVEQQPRFPRVEWHHDFLSKDDLIKLYAEMDALVAPFRGEGFGMKILDAMALGVPVLMPAFGGPLEFAAEGTFLRVDHDVVSVRDGFDMRNAYLGAGAAWCEPKREDLAARLRETVDHREATRAVGRKARTHVLTHYSWRQAAERFINALRHWESERLVTVAARRPMHPSPLSVVIPTYNRPDSLAKALRGYQEQTLSRDRYEIILVNDHGDEDAVQRVVTSAGEGLDLRVHNNTGPQGPAAARNMGIDKARGEVVLITGDDIVPAPHFLDEHLDAHKKHRGWNVAVLGKTDWHPDLDMTPFMQYLTGEGGQQFAYADLRPGGRAPFDRFYTSNVSLKRSFLVEEETLFSTQFPAAAYEDIELAYRLHLRGMQMRYIPDALGYHDHAMDPGSFLKRQVRVGQMLTLLSLVQPPYVPDEHTVFLRMLELARTSPDFRDTIAKQAAESGAVLGSLAEIVAGGFNDILALLPALTMPPERALATHDAASLTSWLAAGSGALWDCVNELALRQGMAEAWATDDEERRWATHLALLLALPGALTRGAHPLGMVYAGAQTPRFMRMPGGRLLVSAAMRARTLPVVGAAVERLEQSAPGRLIRRKLVG
jgi:GT2 family glycosyltransferase